MVSSRLEQALANFDEIVAADDPDYAASGVKTPSVIRVTRVAVVEDSVLAGCIGAIGQDRLLRIRARLADWIRGDD